MSEKVFRVVYQCNNCSYDYFQEYEKGVKILPYHELPKCPVCDVGPLTAIWREPITKTKENLIDNSDNIVPLLENKGCNYRCTLE